MFIDITDIILYDTGLYLVWCSKGINKDTNLKSVRYGLGYKFEIRFVDKLLKHSVILNTSFPYALCDDWMVFQRTALTWNVHLVKRV